MAIINKPELDSIWASEGAKTKPPLDKIKQGWISEIPPHQYENWIQNKQDEFNAYVNQKGIPEWDGVTEYYKDKSFVQDNKKIYVSVRDSGGSLAISKQPSLDVAGDYWKVVSFSSDELKQTTGQSTKDVMSQKAVTDAIDNSTTGKADKTVSINAGSGLVGGGNLSTSRTLSVNYGTTAGTSAQGNDSRFAQGVAAFGWGNHALAGYSKTDTTYYVGEGLTQTGFRFDVKFGTTLGSVMQGNDSRVVNAVPKDRKVLAGTGLNGGGSLEADRTFSVKYGNTAGTAVEGNDVRFSNLQPTGNLSENGWTRLPNGLILQWGFSPVIRGQQALTISFNIPYSNCFNVTATLESDTWYSGNSAVYSKVVDSNSFILVNDHTTSATPLRAFWQAIGI